MKNQCRCLNRGKIASLETLNTRCWMDGKEELIMTKGSLCMPSVSNKQLWHRGACPDGCECNDDCNQWRIAVENVTIVLDENRHK